MNMKRILITAIAAAMMMCFAACDNGDTPDDTESKGTKEPSVTTNDTTNDTANGNDTEGAPDNSEDVIYQLPAGAASEYELYTTVVDYLNNGFHTDDLKDVFDPVLTAIAIYTRPSEFALEMRYDELCALIVKLRDTWSKVETMRDTCESIDEFCDAFRSEFPGFMPDENIESDGEFEEIIYNLFQSQCPEKLQAEINEKHSKFENFVDAGVFHNLGRNFSEGQNPYGSDQTEWEKMSEDELETSEFVYDEEYENLSDNFPPMYFMHIGEYREQINPNVTWLYEMEIIYIKIESRYYIVSFTGAVI